MRVHTENCIVIYYIKCNIPSAEESLFRTVKNDNYAEIILVTLKAQLFLFRCIL